MHLQFKTADKPMPERSRYWRDVVASTYFPLELHFREPDRFGGSIAVWQLGAVSLTRNTSAPLSYKRLARHIQSESDEHFLVTVPALSEIAFSQCGRDVRCRPGNFLLERSHEPYEFSHEDANDLWVLKVPAHALGGRIRSPDRFCSLQFDATNGVGGLFSDMLHLVPGRFDNLSDEARAAVGRQLVDLVALAIRDDGQALVSGASSVREAHLTRIERHMRHHLADPDLDPEKIAQACGISTRYLHELFRDTNRTVGQWIREQRLIACSEALADQANRQTVAEIAYHWGFGDQAQFSRAFKARFGLSPRDFRYANLRR
jgi:AraC-like DNA-binding protein